MITGAESARLAPKTTAIYLEGKLPLVLERAAAELGLRDTQVVQGTLEAKLDTFRLTLQGLAGAAPQASIALPNDLPANWRLAAGDTALFRAQVLANGSLVLHPLPAAPSAAPAAHASAVPTLPGRAEQLSYRPPGMQALAQLLRPGVLQGMLQGLPASSPELAALRQWLTQRPGMAQLNTEKLKQSMHGSGFMTERLLAQGMGAGLLDLKSVLRQLLRSGSVSDTDGLLRNSIDDIESQQLQGQESLQGHAWAFSMMLPFADSAPVSLRWVRGQPTADQHTAPWVIELHTRNQDLGEIWLQTRISGQTDVDMVMWAEREEVATQAQALAGHLAQELDSAGLNMTRLQIIHGQGPQHPRPRATPAAGSLLDVHT